jgi:hypothetical protein
MSQKSVLLLALVFTLPSVAAVADINVAQLQATMDAARCPDDLAPVSFLDYGSVCGPQPEGASRTYLSCQNRVDKENNVISSYNNFLQKCAANSAPTGSDLARRYKSQQSTTQQSEQQGTKQRYERQIQIEETQEQEKNNEDLAEQRRKFDEDMARQNANKAAEKAKADAAREPSIMPTPAPRASLSFQAYNGAYSSVWLMFSSYERDRPDCTSVDGLMVCTASSKLANPYKDQFIGSCIDVRRLSDRWRVCVSRGRLTAKAPEYAASADYCVDIVCVPASTPRMNPD